MTATALIVALARATLAASCDSGVSASPTCAAESPGLPHRIHIPADLRRHAETMLATSATFRRQCRRIESAPWLRVLVRVDPSLVEGRYRARSTIERTRSGAIIATVYVSLWNPVEWIAHEFEHIVEQLDGVNLAERAAQRSDVWLTGGRMFETERAIQAGRAVLRETRCGPRRPGESGDVD